MAALKAEGPSLFSTETTLADVRVGYCPEFVVTQRSRLFTPRTREGCS